MEKKLLNFSKDSPKSHQSQKRPKYLQQSWIWKSKTSTSNHFWNLKIPTNKPCFETAYLGKNVINLLKQKVAQKVTIIFGYVILSKILNEPPKVAQLAKNRPIWSTLRETRVILLGGMEGVWITRQKVLRDRTRELIKLRITKPKRLSAALFKIKINLRSF